MLMQVVVLILESSNAAFAFIEVGTVTSVVILSI
jgi:hypothetical protein